MSPLQMLPTHAWLQEWQRASHGTGMGCSSTAGFWIPDKAPQALLPLSSMHSSSKKAGCGSLIVGKPSKHNEPLKVQLFMGNVF